MMMATQNNMFMTRSQAPNPNPWMASQRPTMMAPMMTFWSSMSPQGTGQVQVPGANNGPRANYKYAAGVQNVQGQVVSIAPQPMMPLQPQSYVLFKGQAPLTASMFATAPLYEQKQMLGDRLFPLIQNMHADLAGKITGMLLEIDNSELVHMLEHQESLKSKVEEAVAVLQAHKTQIE